MNNTIGGAKETARSRLFARISKEQVVVALDQPRLSLDSRTYTRAPPRSVVDSRSKLPTLWPSSPLRPSALGVEAWSPPDADQLAGACSLPHHLAHRAPARAAGREGLPPFKNRVSLALSVNPP
jgi:hypothetical protein